MCPACGEAMVAYELDGIEIDHCVACLGTWLDTGELEMITGRAGVAPGAVTDLLARPRGGPRTRRRCPRCPRRLHEISVGREPVHLDRCPWGHGLWLDRGEMLTVIRSVAVREEEATAVAAFFADLYRSEISTEMQEP